jgi:hypothetical protein
MKIIAERTFTLEDQLSFARLSGDYNPMHVDPVAARRTVFGAPVVHGVHLLCWAMDNWLRDRGAGMGALSKLNCRFNRGVLVGDKAAVVVLKDGEEFTLQIRKDQTDTSSFQGCMGPGLTDTETLPGPALLNCRENDFAAAAKARGVMPLGYCPSTARQLFPHLALSLPAVQIATLLATTRLVGMECPGLHSLYSAMDLSFATQIVGPPEMKFHTEHADDRFGLLRLAVEGPGFTGKLRTFLRPAPSRQARMADLAPLVEKTEFAGQRAVVVGGSRGLGEVTAKLLALGGAQVVITYHRGKEDAEAVSSEIGTGGGDCSAAFFDSNQPERMVLADLPTHIYYFATGHITSEKGQIFSERLFADYCRYYVTGFANTAVALAGDSPSVDLLYPSSVFLEEPAEMAEYCAAKAAGEELCRQLAARFPGWRLHAPRLPRMLTDQNNGFLPGAARAPATIMLPHLRAMVRRSR